MPVEVRLTYDDHYRLPNDCRQREIVDKDPRAFQKPEPAATGFRKRAKSVVTAW
jgi:hypothetical protein